MLPLDDRSFALMEFVSLLYSHPEKTRPVLKVGAGIPDTLSSFIHYVAPLAPIEVIEKYSDNLALRTFKNLPTYTRLGRILKSGRVSFTISDINDHELHQNFYKGVFCSDLISHLTRNQGERVIVKLLHSLDEYGVFYFDFCGPQTWDYRTKKDNYEEVGERSYRLRTPELCAYGGCHEFLTMYAEEDIRTLLKGYNIYFMHSREAPSDFSDGRPFEDIIVVGSRGLLQGSPINFLEYIFAWEPE